MNHDDRMTLLLTCSRISHTGKLTTLTGDLLRFRHPGLFSRHVQLTALAGSLEKEFNKGEYLIASDGCEEEDGLDRISTRCV